MDATGGGGRADGDDGRRSTSLLDDGEVPIDGGDPDHELASTSSRNQCYLCSRTYERPDHLSRHLKSHENERSYRCSECGKGFNRADLLNRHKAAHMKSVNDALRKRTGRACAACIKAKTKCDEDRPCKRCRTRDVACEETEFRKSTSQPIKQIRRSPSPERQANSNVPPNLVVAASQHGLTQPIPIAPMQQTPLPSVSSSRHLEEASLLLGLNHAPVAQAPMLSYGTGVHESQYMHMPPFTAGMTPVHSGLTPLNAGMTPTNTGLTPFSTLDMQSTDFVSNGFGFPDFFEQLMMPDTFQHPAPMPPPDVSNMTSDLTFDDCDFDFSFLASGLTRPPTVQAYHTTENGVAIEAELTPSSDAHLRSEAFKRNPWSWNHWIPERNSHTFSGQETIDVGDAHVNTRDQLTSPDSIRPVNCDLGSPERDRMIRVVTKVAHTRLSIPSFPSLELLEDLIEIYLLQDSSAIDSFYHSASFASDNIRTEMLLSMVAAGARYIALAPVWKMGLIVQEVVRLAIADLLESDNAMTRELEILQAFMLVLDIGVWSGFRRKTEIAISFLQPPVTMLTWSNAFRRSGYRDFVPSMDLSDNQLESSWRSWAEQEAKKRLILHTFVHDSQVAIVHMKNPLIAPSQLLLALPASRELWLAPNAHAWRHAYLRLNPPAQSATPSMLDFFGSNTMLDQCESMFDKTLCLLAACYAIGQEIWHFRTQSRLLSNWQNHGRRDRWSDHQRLQRDLYDDLSTVHTNCEMQTNATPEIMMTLELLSMSLHVDLEDIQTFSGKLGEEEARKVCPRVLAWCQTGESRIAVWHAGQVFRVARSFEKTRLRDFYAVALYHSALTLWVYGMVTYGAARKSSTDTPTHSFARPSSQMHTNASSASRQHVSIDTSSDKVAKSFKLLGQGSAGVQDAFGRFVPLSNSKGLMATAESILKNNFPQSRRSLPPLVENLANLMSELGKLSGRE
ncbi:hypothetical protein LTR62_003426 [Meristemomyces frigidus]|uniref:Uncharacterized protein n=1 Tax=Meristemomyces frigidus TaxID=1508187 RepID=A0AAN7TFN1_9PEZI|nr:hypothetical protein LTR62_003426 [Meristemomyces frigidus]